MSILRRRRPAAGEYDARALEAANRYIVDLEMRLTGLQHRRDRERLEHVLGCPDALQLATTRIELANARLDLQDAEKQVQAARRDHADVYRRLRGLADLVRQDDTQTLPAADAAGPAAPGSGG